MFSSQFIFLPLDDASVCSEKMAAPREKAFCVLEYHTSRSVFTVQRAFVQSRQTTRLQDLGDLNLRIIAAVKNIDAPMLTRVCVCVCVCVCGKNLNIASMCTVSPVVHPSNISSC